MTQVFAFDVAVTEDAGVDLLGHYDPDLQQFVWAGDGEVSLGAAVCTRTSSGTRYHVCSGGGTACRLIDPCTAGSPCYRCDYG
jgi:hypothetical protein